MVKIACPGAEQLRQLLLGKVADDQSEVLEQHLAECDPCARTVADLKIDDTLVQALQKGAPVVQEAEEAVSKDMLEKVRAIRPDADQHTEDSQGCTRTIPPATPDATSTGEGCYDFLAPPQSADEIGRLGHYRILKVLGKGGMGMVFRAEDENLNREVALKVMLPEIAARPEARDRFKREARTAARIEHDNIVAIYQVSEDRGVPFIAMPLLQGRSMEDWLQERQKKTGGAPMNLAQILKLGREIARGLGAAHDRGLIHRDIKPANIWLDANAGGRAKILDFGLARPRESEQNITQSGVILGTPTYMSPEQGRSEKIDGRADLWSLGVVLYRLCTGVLPFRGEDTMSTLLAIVLNEPVPVSKLNPNLPPELSALVMKLLEKKPEDRQQTAHEVVKTITGIEKELAAKALRSAPTAALTPAPVEAEKVKKAAVSDRAAVVPAAAPKERHGHRWSS